MTAAQDLRVLVDVTYPQIVDNLNVMLVKLDEKLVETQEEIVTITDGVLGAAEIDHLAALEAKRVANGWAYVKTFGDYGTKNLTDWQIFAFSGSPIPATYLTDDSFRVNVVVSPAIESPILAQPGSIQRNISTFTWGPPQPPPPPPPVFTYTNVALLPGTALPAGLTNVEFSSVIYSPTVNWDSDPALESHQDAYLIGLDQLEAEINIDGTYGLEAREDQIDLGILVQTKNRDKYVEFITVYEPYAA